MPPADSTLTTDSAPARSTTEESANAIDGRSANLAEDPVEDTADATDATDADLLEVLSNDNPTTANLEQYGRPAEAQSFAAASIDPAPTVTFELNARLDLSWKATTKSLSSL